MNGKTPAAVARACERVAGYYYGEKGLWAYRMFAAINAAYFDGGLPWPLIVWGLTAHGACLGQVRVTDSPVITLHPTLLAPRTGPRRAGTTRTRGASPPRGSARATPSTSCCTSASTSTSAPAWASRPPTTARRGSGRSTAWR